jgi:hypothetical protein
VRRSQEGALTVINYSTVVDLAADIAERQPKKKDSEPILTYAPGSRRQSVHKRPLRKSYSRPNLRLARARLRAALHVPSRPHVPVKMSRRPFGTVVELIRDALTERPVSAATYNAAFSLCRAASCRPHRPRWDLCEHCRAAHSPVVGVAIRTSAERRFSLPPLIELRTSQQSATQPMEFRVVVAFAACFSQSDPVLDRFHRLGVMPGLQLRF